LFALGLDNMGIIIIIFDLASLCTAGLIVLCERPDENENSKKALFYFLVSIFTSLLAYVGIYFISTGHHSFSFTFYYLFNENGGSLEPLNGYAILG
jgi:formate hydrogenlyase subunit 3/multisubunit Na+/H+ antiporter MnhD subunit